MSQPVDKSSSKFVLVAMADCVNNEAVGMTCWPSYKHLTERTGQDIKTVEAGLRRLRDSGFITDTGERKGSTGQVIVYRLNTPVIGAVETGRKTPVFPAKTPVFPIKDPQISHIRPPKTGDGTNQGPSKGTKKEGESAALSIPDVPDQLMLDYLAVRKIKKGGPITNAVINGFEREARKAGISNEQAAQVCCEANWIGFNAGWYEKRVATPDKAAETPYARQQREKWETVTGRNRPQLSNDFLEISI